MDETEVRRDVVYLIEAIGLNRVKIGFASEICRRFRQIRTSCPVPIWVLAIVPGSTEMEAGLHQEFADRRRCGEWFAFDSEEIKGLCSLRDTDKELWHRFLLACMLTGSQDSFRPMPEDAVAMLSGIYLGMMEEAASV